MKRTVIALLLAALTCAELSAQTDNTLYARAFPGQNVGAKVAAAEAACNPSTVIPCLIVIDPSLAAYAPGVLPPPCTQCSVLDLQTGYPKSGGVNLNVVTDCGAIADGVTDQSAAFNSCQAKANAAGGGAIYLPYSPNAYVVGSSNPSAPGGVLVGSNTTWWSDSRATVVQRIQGAATTCTTPGCASVFYTAGGTTNNANVWIRNLTVDGNRAAMSGITGDGGMFGILLQSCTNCGLDHVTVQNAYTGGVQVYCTDTTGVAGNNTSILDSIITNSRRNNLEVICGTNVHMIGGQLSNANGGSLSAGVDLEPDGLSQPAQLTDGFSMSNVEVFGNTSGGVLIQHEEGANPTYTFTDLNVHDNGTSASQFYAVNFMASSAATASGTIKINGGRYSGGSSCVSSISIAGFQTANISGVNAYGCQRGILENSWVNAVNLSNSSVSGVNYDISPNVVAGSIVNLGSDVHLGCQATGATEPCVQPGGTAYVQWPHGPLSGVSASPGSVLSAGASNPVLVGGATGSCSGQYAKADGTGCGNPITTSLTATGFPTVSCTVGQTLLATDTGQVWNCDQTNIWTNAVTGVTSTGNATYNTGLLARYRMADCTSTTIPDTSGNSNTGTFATFTSPWYGHPPTCTSGSGVSFIYGGSNEYFVFIPPAAVNGMQTVIAYYQQTGNGAAPTAHAQAILLPGGSPTNANLTLRAGDGGPVVGYDGIAQFLGSSQLWRGVAPLVETNCGTSGHFFYQGSEVSGYQYQGTIAAISGSTQAYLGAGVPNYNDQFIGTMYYLETYSGCLTQAQIASETARINVELQARGLTLGNQINPAKQRQIVWDGTSITEGLGTNGDGTNGGTNSYVGYTAASLGNSYWTIDNGISGQLLSSALPKVQTTDISQLQGLKPIVIADFPTNDIVASGSVTTAETNIASFCAAVRTAYSLCVPSTVLPRTVAGSSTYFSANRSTYNTWLRSNWKTFADALADPASDPTIGPDAAATNGSYWNTDGTHPLAAADAIAAPYYVQAILYAGTGDPLAQAADFSIASGCGTPGSLTSGPSQAGSFTAGQAACVPVITLGITAPHGFVCKATDLTNTADTLVQTASSTTTCTVSGTVTSGDTIAFTWSWF